MAVSASMNGEVPAGAREHSGEHPPPACPDWRETPGTDPGLMTQEGGRRGPLQTPLPKASTVLTCLTRSLPSPTPQQRTMGRNKTEKLQDLRLSRSGAQREQLVKTHVLGARSGKKKGNRLKEVLPEPRLPGPELRLLPGKGPLRQTREAAPQGSSTGGLELCPQSWLCYIFKEPPRRLETASPPVTQKVRPLVREQDPTHCNQDWRSQRSNF